MNNEEMSTLGDLVVFGFSQVRRTVGRIGFDDFWLLMGTILEDALDAGVFGGALPENLREFHDQVAVLVYELDPNHETVRAPVQH